MTLVIGVGGLLASGKDTFADRLVEVHGFVKLGMSDVLADALRVMDPWIVLDKDIEDERAERSLFAGEMLRYRSLEEAAGGYVEAKKQAEVREWLQRFGTEVGRHLLGEDTWTRAARRRIESHTSQGRDVVITGIRYANELALIQELGDTWGTHSHLAGTTVWVDRSLVQAPTSSTAAHSSENSVRLEDFEYVLDNSGDLEALYRASDSLLRIIRADFT